MEYIHAGTQHLISAKQLQRNTRKWMCVAVICASIILLAIVLGVVFAVKK